MSDPSTRSKLLSRIRAPSPAAIISVIALAFAMAGGAIAATSGNSGPVKVVTSTGGPATVTGTTANPNNGGQAIPLARATFTQKAGQVVLVAGELNVTGTDQGEQNCDLSVTVAGDSTSAGAQSSPVGLEMVRLARRGDPGDRVASEAVPAPASARVIALSAHAVLGVENYDPNTGSTTVDPCTAADSFTVSLRVSRTLMPS